MLGHVLCEIDHSRERYSNEAIVETSEAPAITDVVEYVYVLEE